MASPYQLRNLCFIYLPLLPMNNLIHKKVKLVRSEVIYCFASVNK